MEPISIALGLAKLTGLDKTIGRWIGGDNGEEVAGKVVSIAQQVTGGSTPEKALAMMKEDKDARQAFEHAMLNNEQELKRLAFKDRDSARNMQIAALNNKDKFSKRFVYLFSIGWSLFAFVYIGLITFWEIPESSVRFADTILGFLLGTALAGMFNFFFGSSHRDEQAAELQQGISSVIQSK